MTVRYKGENGGRYIYHSDLEGIQDISFEILKSIFSESGDMIVSGIIPEKNKITSGYVLIDNILRKIPETSVSKYPVYIYEKNTIESVQYENEQSKVGRIRYEAIVTDKEPIDIIDSVTNKQVGYLSINEDVSKNRTIKSVYFDKTVGALIKNSKDKQTITSEVHSKNKSLFDNLRVVSSFNIGDFGVSAFEEDNAILFKKGTAVLLKISADGSISFPESKVTVSESGVGSFSKVIADKINIENQDIYVSSGEMIVNRNKAKKKVGFKLFDGVSSIIEYIANSDIVKFLIAVVVNKNITVIDSNSLRTEDDFGASIDIQDKDKTSVFSVTAKKDKVEINSKETIDFKSKKVNFGGTVTLNDKDISKKFVDSNDYEKDKKSFVVAKEGYQLTEAVFEKDEKEKLKTLNVGNLDEKEKIVLSDALRDEFNNKINKDKLLSDLDIEDDDDRRKICGTIGTLYKDDIQPKISDTGWKPMVHPTAGEIHNLKCRQIGNQVWIQGTINTNTAVSYVLAKIPNSISAPSYDVYQSFHQIANQDRNRGVSVKIKAKTTNLYISEISRYDNNDITINITYLIN